MKTDFESFNNPYHVCDFLNTLKPEQVISVTDNLGSFYVFYKKK